MIGVVAEAVGVRVIGKGAAIGIDILLSFGPVGERAEFLDAEVVAVIGNGFQGRAQRKGRTSMALEFAAARADFIGITSLETHFKNAEVRSDGEGAGPSDGAGVIALVDVVVPGKNNEGKRVIGRIENVFPIDDREFGRVRVASVDSELHAILIWVSIGVGR